MRAGKSMPPSARHDGPKSEQNASAPRLRRPLHPYLVLAAAVILPGGGQVLNRMPTRGLIMIFFMLSLGIVTMELAAPGRSFIGRHAGGFFVYAIAVMDAYMTARYRWALFRQRLSAPSL
ncbi:hypothetical protein [Paraburkholderia solitsugae]|uniref:hypothetical protein n=1 Tax=Paraburkholderia solitsugae TaxID=2675748 RepID=UPI001F43D641|nr:hypothetical protein [Paraburkholderia solitsugae]